MATTGTLMTANNIYGLVNPPTDPSANDPLAHQTINSGATNWGSHVDLSNAVVRLTTNQTIGGDKTFTGTLLVPTPVESDNTTKIATTAFVKTSIDNLVDSAPNNLNTLNELAAAINDDNNFHNTVTTALAGKHPSITTSARLNANLIGDNGDVSNTEYGYLNGVTSAIQTQIDSKQATITNGSITLQQVNALESILNSKAPLNGPIFEGSPTAPTATAGTNTTQLATTAFVKTAVDNLVDSAPGALDTLNELAAAIGDDSNYAATVTTALSGKHPSITTSARLNANLIGDNGDVSNTEYGYLNGVTSAIQTQIDSKQATITDGDLTIARTTGLQTALDSKQATITDGDLTIARTNGLQTALDLKAPIAGPTFTGTPAAPTATAGTNTTQLATTAFVKTAVDNLVDSAPGALDTLNELAAAIGDDANYAATVTTALSGKHPSITTSARLNANLIGDNGDVSNTEYGYLNGVTSAIQTQIDSKQTTIGDGDLTIARTNGLQAALDAKQATITDGDLTIARTTGLQAALDAKAALAGPTFTGTPIAPTATAGTNTTQIATTAFVKTSVDNLISSAPGALDTLNELAAAIGDDANYAATVTTALATKQASITTSARLNANLIHDGSVSNTIFGRLANVTDDIQAQLNAKQASLTSTGSGEVITSLERTNLKDVSNNAVRLTGAQTVAGAKTFTSNLIGDLTGNASTVTNGVYTTGNQTIGGVKTFTSEITGDLAGNASTATALENTRTIAGQNFNGTQNVSIAATDLSDITSAGSGIIITATERTDYTDVSNNAVRLTGAQTVAGAKTFSSAVTIGNYTLPTTAGTQGQVLKYPSSGSTLTWGSSGSGGSSIDTTTDVSLNDLGVYGDLSCNAVKLGGHIIPDTNAAYDLGNAEYKIRHLFLSDNSLWVGDNHKIDISGGKMKFKKRKTNVVPAAITAASGSDSAAIAHAGVSSLTEMKLHHWEAYAHTLSGLETSNIKDIFVSGTPGDWEEDEELGGSTTTKKGQVLETVAGLCDGRTVEVESATYTLPNVTAVFQPTDGTTYVDLPNSSFSYKPPTGTKQVIYRYKINIAGDDSHPIANFKLYIDDTEVSTFVRSWTGKGPDEDTLILDYTFEIGLTNDITKGKFLTWNSNKTIKIKVREHSSSGHEVKFYSRGYWEGSYQYNADGFVCPSLEIIAIGEGTVGAVSNAVTTSGDQTISGTKTFNDAIISASYTTTQRDALTAVAGMVIFNTTVNKHQGYNGSSWNNFY